MTELKPCPKCGSTEIVGRVYGGNAAYGCGEYDYEVECKCGILFTTSHTSETAEEAEKLGITEWNTKIERTCNNVSEPPLGFECSECHFSVTTDPTDGYDWNTGQWKACPSCGAKITKEKENKMIQPNIDKPIAESLEEAGVKENQSVSECIACIMDALDDLAPLIADDEHITAEVNKDSVAVSLFKGESFAKTSAVLMSRQKDSDEWETTVYGSLLEMICHMYDRCCGDGESSLMESIKNREDN